MCSKRMRLLDTGAGAGQGRSQGPLYNQRYGANSGPRASSGGGGRTSSGLRPTRSKAAPVWRAEAAAAEPECVVGAADAAAAEDSSAGAEPAAQAPLESSETEESRSGQFAALRSEVAQQRQQTERQRGPDPVGARGGRTARIWHNGRLVPAHEVAGGLVAGGRG